MSWIKKIRIKNYLGIEELELTTGKLNILSGKTGSGKTSFIDAIEKAYTNKDRRTKGIRTGEDEAILFIEQTDGLTIDRKVRGEKSDYLSLKKDEHKIKSTEAQLRKILNGDIFRPLEWAKRPVKEQTDSILNMINIEFTEDDIQGWFGEKPQDGSIVYSQHILQLLKDIETYYFNIRTELKRDRKSKSLLLSEIKDTLPENYDGEKWKDIDLADVYDKLNDVRKQNAKQQNASDFIVNQQSKLDSITLKVNGRKELVKEDFDFKNISIEKGIQEHTQIIDSKRRELKNSTKKETDDIETNLKLYNEEVAELKEKYKKFKLDIQKEFVESRQTLEDEIIDNKNKINDLKTEISDNSSEKNHRLELIAKDEKHEKEKLTIELEENEKLSKIDVVDEEQFVERINNVKENQSFIREWERTNSISNEIKNLENEVGKLEKQIKVARSIPSQLLKKANCPIEEISIGENNEVLVYERPVDNMSEGEVNKFALSVAKQQAGELKVICLDGFHSLNPSEQEKMKNEIKDDEFQYFVTVTTDDEFGIKTEGDING